MNGPTLMKQGPFYDEVMRQAAVWVPRMKKDDFDKVMRMKFEARSYSDDYEEEAAEDMKFIKYFGHYISKKGAHSDTNSLLVYKRPYFNMKKKYIEFNLNDFEDHLEEKRINMPRVDLVLKVQKILKAKKVKGKINNKSCVRWRIQRYDVPKEHLIIEGDATEVKEKANDQA